MEVVEERKRSNSLGSAISSNSRNIQQRKPAPWHVTKKRVIWKDGLLQKCLRNFVNKFPDLKIVGGGSTVQWMGAALEVISKGGESFCLQNLYKVKQGQTVIWRDQPKHKSLIAIIQINLTIYILTCVRDSVEEHLQVNKESNKIYLRKLSLFVTLLGIYQHQANQHLRHQLYRHGVQEEH